MKTRTVIKLVGLGLGALGGGPLGAWLGSQVGDLGCEFLNDALGDENLKQTVGGVFGNLFADQLGGAFATSELPGFNHDFRKALAQALLKSFDWDDAKPGPVQRTLLAGATYGVASERDRARLRGCLERWQEELRRALKALPDLKPLEHLFPAGQRDADYLALTDDVPEAHAAALWTAFYDKALAPLVQASPDLPHLGGADLLRREVLAALALEFPGQFAEVIKADDFKRSWIAFQKTLLLASRREIGKLGDRFTKLEARLEQLASPACELRLNDALTEALGAVRQRLDGTYENTQVIRAVVDRHTGLLNDLLAAVAREGAQTRDAVAELERSLKARIDQLQAPCLPLLKPRRILEPPLHFTGREADVTAIVQRLSAGGVNISGVSGLGGIGKTALARAVAFRLRDLFPDGWVQLDLRGADPTQRPPLTPVQALEALIREFLPDKAAKLPEEVDDLRNLWLDLLNDGPRRVLVLLDNAADAAQVRPLLPPRHCVVLVTSRQRFAVDGVQPHDLDVLTPEAARELLLRLAPRIEGDAAAVATVLGNLPLALEVFAGLATEHDLTPVAELLTDVRAHRRHLEPVEAVFTTSLARLPAALRERWLRLAVFPGGFDAPAAGAVWEDTSAGTADDTVTRDLQTLRNASLVQFDAPARRFRLHDLAREFGWRHLPAGQREQAASLHATHFARVLARADELLLAGHAGVRLGLELFDAERTNVEAGHAWAASHADAAPEALRLLAEYPNAGAYVLDLRQHPRERIRWLELQASACRRLGDRRGEGTALGNLGNAHAALGDARRAIEFYEQRLVIAREIGDRRGEGADLGNLGLAHAALGDARRAIEFFEQALVIAREIGDRRGEGNARFNSALSLMKLGQRDEALRRAEAALAIFQAIESPHAAQVQAALDQWRAAP